MEIEENGAITINLLLVKEVQFLFNVGILLQELQLDIYPNFIRHLNYIVVEDLRVRILCTKSREFYHGAT